MSYTEEVFVQDLEIDLEFYNIPQLCSQDR